MKKFYKVFSRACVRPKGKYIVEATEEDMRAGIWENIEHYTNGSECDFENWDNEKLFEEFQDKLYMQVYENFLNNMILSCGDYLIVFDEFENVAIPNSVGWEIF